MPTSDSADTAQPIEGDQPLTLNVLRRLVRNEWARLPGETLVVLSRDSEGNLYSPFSTYNIGRYAPDYGLTGEVYPLESEGARAWGRRRGSSIGGARPGMTKPVPLAACGPRTGRALGDQPETQ